MSLFKHWGKIANPQILHKGKRYFSLCIKNIFNLLNATSHLISIHIQQATGMTKMLSPSFCQGFFSQQELCLEGRTKVLPLPSSSLVFLLLPSPLFPPSLSPLLLVFVFCLLLVFSTLCRCHSWGDSLKLLSIL